MVNCKVWADDNEAELRSLWVDPTITNKEIAIRLKASAQAIRRKAKRMNLGERPPLQIAGLHWRPDEDALLKTYVANGLASKEISLLIPARSACGCSARARELGLVKYAVAEKTVEAPASLIIRLSAPPPSQLDAPIPPAKCCQYPTWGNTDRISHILCEAPLYRGSYCVDHWGLCYVSIDATESVS